MTTTINKPTNFDELYEAVKEKRIVAAINKEGKKKKLFISTPETGSALCEMLPRKSRRGRRLYNSDFENYTKFVETETNQTEEEKQVKSEKTVYGYIAKYRKLAMKASFTNSFIESCKALPASFEEWVKEGKKTLYNYSITTGNAIDGKVITLKRIAKKYPHYAEYLKTAIKEQKASHICSHVPFAGYEMSLSTQMIGDSANYFMGYLSLEYKGMLNGYYYLLINDEEFIGYDVD